MKSNKHPHHDLIVEWLKDTSKEVQFLVIGDLWKDCKLDYIIKDLNLEVEFRFKPREFQKGHWYPCLRDGREFICRFSGGYMHEPVNSDRNIYHITWATDNMWIGESLGEIKFGGEE